MRRRIQLGGIIGILLACGAAWAQEKQGPLTPPPKRDIPRIPTENKPEAPPVPAEEIIRRFVQKEDESKRALDTYTFHTSVRVQEYAEDGSVIGEAQLVSETYVKSDGQRYARILQEPPTTLKHARFLLVDLQELTATPQFLLTSDQLAKYNLTYAGQQQVDELNTFAFQVKPKQVDRRERRFEGVVWVDDHDFEIVKTYGRFVSEVIPDDPFRMFETYRESVDGKLRLPTYVRSEGKQILEKGEARVRLTLRYTEYKPPAPK